MSDFSIKNSFFTTALNALQSLAGRNAASAPSVEGVQHRLTVLRVKEGRIIEQSARLNGC